MARFEFRGVEGENEVSLGPVDVDLSPDLVSGGARATVRIGGGTLSLGERSVDVRRIDAEAVASGEDLEVRAGEIETEAGDARAEGRIDTLSPFTGTFDLEFQLDAARLGRLLLENDLEGPHGIGGEVEGAARLRFSDGSFASDGEVEGSRLAFRDLGPFDGDARWDLREDLLRVNGLFHRGALRIEMESAMDLTRNEQALALNLQSPSLNGVLAAANGPRSPWDAGIDAKLSGRMAGFAPGTLDGRGVIRLSGRDLAGSIDVRAEAGRVLVQSDGLRFPGGRATARARVTNFDAIAAEYELAVSDLAPALEPFVAAAPSPVSGELTVRGRTAGRLADLDSLRSSLRVESDDFRIQGSSFVLYARAEQQGTSLDFDRLSLAAAENGSSGSASLTGEVDFGKRRMDVLGSLDTFPIEYLTPVESLSGDASGQVTAAGSFDRPLGTASIELSALGYSGVALPPLGLDLQSDGAQVNARATRLDSGAVVASAQVTLGGDYPLAGEVDLDALPWKELATRLPSTATVAVSGEARVRAPLRSPSLVEADVVVEQASLAIRDRTIATSPFTLGVRRETAEVRGLELLFEDRALAVDGTLSLDGETETRLAVEGEVALEMIELWIPGLEAEGAVEIDAELRGSIREPRLEGAISLDGGRLIDGDRAIEGLRLRARAAGAYVEVEALEAEVLGGSVTARGTVPLPGGMAETRSIAFDLSGADITRLALRPGASRSMVASVSAGGRVVFPDGALDRFEASGEIQEVLARERSGSRFARRTRGMELPQRRFRSRRSSPRGRRHRSPRQRETSGCRRERGSGSSARERFDAGCRLRRRSRVARGAGEQGG